MCSPVCWFKCATSCGIFYARLMSALYITVSNGLPMKWVFRKLPASATEPCVSTSRLALSREVRHLCTAPTVASRCCVNRLLYHYQVQLHRVEADDHHWRLYALSYSSMPNAALPALGCRFLMHWSITRLFDGCLNAVHRRPHNFMQI